VLRPSLGCAVRDLLQQCCRAEQAEAAFGRQRAMYTRVLLGAGIAAAGAAALMYKRFKARNQVEITLHNYEHCPFCVRVRLVAGWTGVPLQQLHHGFGAGVDPSKNDGHGYDPTGGPMAVSGVKSLPAIAGDAVPGGVMSESGLICSFVAAHGSGLPPPTGRADVEDWKKQLMAEMKFPKLVRPRLIQQQTPEFLDPRDVAFFKYQHEKAGFSYAQAEAAAGELAPVVSELLVRLEPLLKGTAWQGAPCLNEWGASMDDVQLLPLLRNLSAVSAVQWPERVRAYVEAGCAAAGVRTFFATAC